MATAKNVEPEDPFDAVPTAPTKKYPTMAQLGTGAEKHSLVYDKDGDQEQFLDSTGRLCIFRPKSVERNVKSQFANNPPSDRWKVDVIVLDGPTLLEALNKEGEVTGLFDPPIVPNTASALIPAMYTNHTVIVGQLDQLSEGGKTFGRVMKLKAKPGSTNRPWAIGRAADPVQAKADQALAVAWLKANPEPDPFD
jgi:hypothetical protein